ncbi:MAG TPA: hypothetical protein VGC38_03810 [Pseudolabrys sp.]
MSKSRTTGRNCDPANVAMKLNGEQLKAFDEQGYVFFLHCFLEMVEGGALVEAE